MQDIVRDFKSFTSRKLKEEIQNHPSESRREWIKWMMERAGNKNGNNNGWQLWQQHNHPIELSDNKNDGAAFELFAHEPRSCRVCE